MDTPHPNDVFKILLEKARHPLKKCNLTHVHRICERQERSGSRIFTIAAIGRLLAADNIMSAKTLLNPSSRDYRTLIGAWATFSRPAKPARVGANDDYDWLMLIPDPAIRTLVQATLSEVSALRGEISILRAHQVPVVLYRGTAASNPNPSDKMGPTISTPLTEMEREALAQAINSNHLAYHDLTIGTRGEIMTASRRVIFDPGFATGLKKLLTR